MTEDQIIEPQRPPVGALVDFVYGVEEGNPLNIEIAVDGKGMVVVFHDKPFKNDLSWYEFDTETCKLDFIIDDGEVRDIGMPLAEQISKHMHNTHQILTVLLDDDTGEAKEGNYIPLIIHQS